MKDGERKGPPSAGNGHAPRVLCRASSTKAQLSGSVRYALTPRRRKGGESEAEEKRTRGNLAKNVHDLNMVLARVPGLGPGRAVQMRRRMLRPGRLQGGAQGQNTASVNPYVPPVLPRSVNAPPLARVEIWN